MPAKAAAAAKKKAPGVKKRTAFKKTPFNKHNAYLKIDKEIKERRQKKAAKRDERLKESAGRKIALTGKDLETLKTRMADLRKRSIAIKSKGAKNRKICSEVMKRALTIKRRRQYPWATLVFKSEKEAQENFGKLKGVPKLEAAYPLKSGFSKTTYVDPNALTVENFPKFASRRDLERAFPRAKVFGVVSNRPRLQYEKKEDALADFQKTGKKVRGREVIVKFALVQDKK